MGLNTIPNAELGFLARGFKGLTKRENPLSHHVSYTWLLANRFSFQPVCRPYEARDVFAWTLCDKIIHNVPMWRSLKKGSRNRVRSLSPEREEHDGGTSGKSRHVLACITTMSQVRTKALATKSHVTKTIYRLEMGNNATASCG